MQLGQSSKVLHLIYKLFPLCERATAIPLLISRLEHPLVYMMYLVQLLCPAIVEVPLGNTHTKKAQIRVSKEAWSHTYVSNYLLW